MAAMRDLEDIAIISVYSDTIRSECAMPRFYFDIREGTRFVPDDTGHDFDGLDTAEDQAVRTATEIGRDLFPSGAREIIVEVRNENGQRVLTVTVNIHIERVGNPPGA
jgi:hypothetical protein